MKRNYNDFSVYEKEIINVLQENIENNLGRYDDLGYYERVEFEIDSIVGDVSFWVTGSYYIFKDFSECGYGSRECPPEYKQYESVSDVLIESLGTDIDSLDDSITVADIEAQIDIKAICEYVQY